VDVAAAVLLFLSSPTAPTVSISKRLGFSVTSLWSFGRVSSCPSSSFCFCSFQNRSRSSVSGFRRSSLCSVASFSAPVPTRKTWSVFSMMRRARLTGYLMSCRSPAAPAWRVLPSIIDASISMRLSIVSAEPVPALKVGLSSMVLTAASTASRAEPPCFRML